MQQHRLGQLDPLTTPHAILRTMSAGVTMKLKVGDQLLGAEFNIASQGGSRLLELILESRGPNRNPDYTHRLLVFLRAVQRFAAIA